MSTLNSELQTDAITGSTKFIGYNKEDEEAIYDLQLMKHFDAMIFIENTNATTPLFK